MKNVIKIGIIVYGVFFFGIAFLLMGGSHVFKENNGEPKTDNLDMERSINTLNDSDCSKSGFCIGDRVELTAGGEQAGMHPINGTIIKISDRKILTVLTAPDETDENSLTLISEDWVQHFKPESESDTASQPVVVASDTSEE